MEKLEPENQFPIEQYPAGITDLLNKENRPPWKGKESSKDAGLDFENMGLDLLKRHPKVFAASFLSSEPDDKKKGADIITFLNSEKNLKLAIQTTATTNPEERKEKLKKIMAKPVMPEIRDEKGQVIFKGVIPIAMGPCDKITWGNALNKAKNEKQKDVSIFLSNMDERKFFEGIVISLKATKEYAPADKNTFEEIIELLEEKILKPFREKQVVH